jgi:hypothetical protein
MSIALALAFALAQEPIASPKPTPPEMNAARAAAARDQALAFIVSHQNRDGSWGTRTIEGSVESFITVQGVYAWQVASNALCCIALMECPETPERRAVLEKGLQHVATLELPKRGDDWDVDHVWAGVFGANVCVRAIGDPRFSGGEWAKKLASRGREFVALLEDMQVPTGGWGYYDDPPFTARPKWATSFTTAAVIPALATARELGWARDPKTVDRAIAFVRNCSLPNGAYSYDLRPIPRLGGETIDDVKGSLGRIQVCNWALLRAGVKSVTIDKVREGLENFFRYHEFLDAARMRPIPHEAYYYNAGYFYFFGHYHAAKCIELLPSDERESWRKKLRPEIVKAQRDDGSFGDFLGSTYMIDASTAFAALALDAGLHDATVQ